MMATWEDLDEEQEGAESQEKEEIVVNLCFVIDIVSDEETEVLNYEPEPSYDDLQKAYDEPLDDSQILFSNYAFIKKTFQKLSLESKKEKLRHEKDELLKENHFLNKNVNVLKAEVSESAQKIVKLLKFDLKKMVNGSKNLDLMLGSQGLYFEKSRLAYEKEENAKSFKSSQSKVPIYIYCFKKSHSFEKCFSRRKAKKQKVK